MTVGNASGINNGAAAVLIMSANKAENLGLASLCIGSGQGMAAVLEMP